MIILIASEKGGVGKSTIAMNLAVACAQQGMDVCIADTDPQASTTAWNRTRQELGVQPTITTVNLTGRIGTDLIGLSRKFDALIIDAGGRDSMEMRESAAIADVWLVPTRANQIDIWAFNTALHIVRITEQETGHKPRAYVLINCVDTLPTIQDANELADALASDSDISQYLPVCPIRLCDRKDYARAPRAGQGVLEYAPKGKAAQEITELLEFIAGQQN